MPRQVHCSEPGCGAVFQVADEKAAQTVYCPQCGSPNEVTAEAPAAAGGEPAPVGAEPAAPEPSEPTEGGEGPNLLPYVIGGAVLLAIGVLVGLVVLAVNLLSKRAEAERRREVRAAAEQKEKAPEPAKPKPKPLVSEDLKARLAEREQQIGAAVEAYKKKLADTLNGLRQTPPEQMAERWADLYLFCREKGLSAEAEQCWLRAVTLGGHNAEVNQKLGRTATYRGEPVTPEQKQFLDRLETRLTLINRDSRSDSYSVTVGGHSSELRWQEPLELKVAPGRIEISLTSRPAEENDEPRQHSIIVEAKPAMSYRVVLKDIEAAPAPDFQELQSLYRAVSRRRRAGGGGAGDGGQDAQKLQEMREMLERLPEQQRQQVEQQLQGAGANSLLGAGDGGQREEVGRLAAEALPGEELVMRLGGRGILVVKGKLSIGEPLSAEGAHVLSGTPETPLHIALSARAQATRPRKGFYYAVQGDLDPALWGAIGAAQGDLASEWARRRLLAHLQDARLRNEELEAQGKFEGPWEATDALRRDMEQFDRQVGKALRLQRLSAARPLYLDRVRSLGASPRSEYLYLNWPRFRTALATVVQPSEGDIFGLVAALGTGKGEKPQRQQQQRPQIQRQQRQQQEQPVRRGRYYRPDLGPPGGIPMGPGGGPPEGVVPEFLRGPSEEEEKKKTPFDPKAVELDAESLRKARVRLTWLLPDDRAMEMLRRMWGSLDEEGRLAAMMRMEAMATPEAVDFLGNKSKQSRQAKVVSEALMSLGAIGTPEALEYCDAPAVLGQLRITATAAKAAAGDPALLQQVTGGREGGGAQFLGYVSQMNTPAARLVLSGLVGRQSSAKARQTLAAAFARLGGHSAAAELRRLVERTGELFPDALAAIAPAEGLLLVGPVGQRALQGSGGSAAIEFLRRMRSETPIAADYLRGAASRGNVEAMKLLLAEGTAEGIEACSESIEAMTLGLLRFAQERWVSGGSWQQNVDQQAAQQFLQKILTSAKDQKLRLATARLLVETGAEIETPQLVALARKPKEAAPEKPGPPKQPGRGGPARQGPGRMEEEMMRRFGGGPMGPGGREGEGFQPSAYTEPTAAPHHPTGWELKGNVQLYGLGLLLRRARDHEEAAASIRKLVDEYQELDLVAAAIRALARLGGAENAKLLRKIASQRPDVYDNAAHLQKTLSRRVAALRALGVAQDAQFLPRLLDMLHEQPPDKKNFTVPPEKYDALSRWYQLKLWIEALECLNAICRDKQLLELTADRGLQEQIRERLVHLIEQPGPRGARTENLRRRLQAEAVRAYGRCARPSDERTRLILNRLALAAREQRQPAARGPVPAFALVGTGGGGGGPLKAALRDAVAHLAIRGGSMDLLTEMAWLLPAGQQESQHWSQLLQQMAFAPSPRFWQAVEMMYGSLKPAARNGIFERSKGKASRYDEAYGEFVVKMLNVALGRQRPEAEGQEQQRRQRRQEYVPAFVRRMQQQAGMGPMGGPPGAQAEEKGPDYERQLAWRQQGWSYSLNQVRKSVERDRRKWQQILRIYEGQPYAVAEAMKRAGMLAKSQFGPALAALSIDQVPSVRGQVAIGLQNVLAGQVQAKEAPSSGPGGRPGPQRQQRKKPLSLAVRRAAALALRRIGGERAAQALFFGLVGPGGRDQAQQPRGGRRPPVGLLPAGIPGAAEAAPAQQQGELETALEAASFAARALGGMGRADLLAQALDARAHAYFNAAPGAVRAAVLEGLAFLPLEEDPIVALKEAIGKMGAPLPGRYVADAFDAAFQRVFGATEKKEAS